MNTTGRTIIISLTVNWPLAEILSAAVSPTLIPDQTNIRLVMPMETAPPILLISGCTERVMLSLRLPFFHWPYSMVSSRNMSISS